MSSSQVHPARWIEAGIGFVQVEAAGHAHEMLDLDLAPRIVSAAPFRNRRRHRGRDKALLGEDADQRVDHRLGHGEAEQRRIDADAGRITLGDHLAVVNHDDRLGAAERRRRRLLEGMIERRLQRRIGWFDHSGAGNLGKQRRRLRLQRLDVALQEIGLLSLRAARRSRARRERPRGCETVRASRHRRCVRCGRG